MKKRLKTEPILLITHKLIWSAASAQRVLCVLFVKCAVFEVITWHISSEQHRQTRTQTKKRWGPALWQPSWGLGNGWSPSQGRNSASSKEKFAHIKRSKSTNHNTERTKQDAPHKAANKKAACRKETVVHHSLHRKRKKCRASNLHAALTENSRP